MQAKPETMLELTTDRLLLRGFRPDDIEPYAALCADPEVMAYVGDHGPLSREDAWRQMAMLAGHWQLRGYGMWALEERASGALVGRLGLHYPDGWPDREVGWALRRHFWGLGYATEAGRAALRHAFETLGWSRLVSLIVPENTRSVRLAERLGERYAGQATIHGHAVSIYAIDRNQWRALRDREVNEGVPTRTIEDHS